MNGNGGWTRKGLEREGRQDEVQAGFRRWSQQALLEGWETEELQGLWMQSYMGNVGVYCKRETWRKRDGGRNQRLSFGHINLEGCWTWGCRWSSELRLGWTVSQASLSVYRSYIWIYLYRKFVSVFSLPLFPPLRIYLMNSPAPNLQTRNS